VELNATSGGVVDRLAYSPAEVAAAFGLSRRAIYRAIASGELRAARVCGGSRLLVPRDEARAWVERNLLAPESRRPQVRPEGEVRVRGTTRPLRAAMAEFEGSARRAA
jgi:excisionase family DNA binding protein